MGKNAIAGYLAFGRKLCYNTCVGKQKRTIKKRAGMDLNVLKYVVEVVETGSISKAAANLFMSQSTLSTQIAAMEKELGRAVFQRTNRGVQLTGYGAEVYHHARAVVRQCDIITQKLFEDVNEHKIKIAAFSSDIISVEFLRVCGFYTEANYEFELCECGTETVLERVKSRDSDIGIVMYSQFQEKKLRSLIQPNDLTIRNLFIGDLRIWVGANSPLASRDSVAASDLEGLFYVEKTHWPEGMFSMDYEIEYMGAPRSRRRLLVNGNKTYHEALSQLPSYSAGPSWSCKWNVGNDLKSIPFQGSQVTLTCGVISRKNELLKEEYENFIRHLLEAYGG